MQRPPVAPRAEAKAPPATSTGNRCADARAADLAIAARGLVKRYGSLRALDGLDLAIARGCFYGLLGPNGAGKSTTLALLTGLRLPTAGQIWLLGEPFDPDAPAHRARLGVVPEEPPLFERLTGFEQLAFTGRLYGLSGREAARRAEDLLGLLGLGRAGGALVADYSRGMKKKLAMGCALIHRPEILLLDEPFEGVDAGAAEGLRRVLAELTDSGTTVVLTTHILPVAEQLCDRVGILRQGRLGWEGDIGALRAEGVSLEARFREVAGGSATRLRLPPWLRPEVPPGERAGAAGHGERGDG